MNTKLVKLHEQSLEKKISLWKRLKPEYKKRLNKSRKDFPYTICYLKNHLRELEFFNDVKFGYVKDLCLHTDMPLMEFPFMFDK